MKYNEKILEKAGKEAQNIIEKSGDIRLKNPNTFWDLKKRILKDKYNIDWKTPQEEEPDTKFN